MAQLVLRDLTKIFGGTSTAVDRLSLSIADGEFVVLVGPSGCGKSTVLRLIAGLEEPTSGEIEIDGAPVDDLPPKARDVAMVFQSYALYPHMSVAENMGFSLKIRHVARADAGAQVAATADVLGLTPLLGRRPVALSGGQRQRVAMGRALVRRPRILLMDEPLSNLDAKLRVAMRGELTRLHQRYHTTTVYVTHDQVEAMTLGDRIAVLDQGRLQQVGTPEELYTAPCNVFVAGFIGSPAMNLARGQLVAADADHPAPDGAGAPDQALCLRAGQWRWPLPASASRERPALAGYLGREIIFGLRPGAFALGEPGGSGAAQFSVEALTVESLGDEKNVLFPPPFPAGTSAAARAGADALELWTARVDPRAMVVSGQRICLTVDLRAAYFFDPETGLAIPTAANPTAASDLATVAVPGTPARPLALSTSE